MVNMVDRGPFLELGSGRTWYLLDPQPEDVCIEDIASTLSKVCRFGGHTREFYSVAQHCVNAAYLARAEGLPPEHQMIALLHDASEAYLVDIPRPLKGILPIYRRMEIMAEQAIADAFGLPYCGRWPTWVKEIDNILLNTEQSELMPPGYPYARGVEIDERCLPSATGCWSPTHAEIRYLETHRGLREQCNLDEKDSLHL